MEKISWLITGGAGFIGSEFVRLGLERDHRLVVLDALTYAGSELNLQNLPTTGEFHFVHGSITDSELLKDLFGRYAFDSVVHLAAESHVDRSISGPSDFIETNIVGSFQLLSASLRYWERLDARKKDRFRYLQVSTDEVYGSLGEDGVFSERSPYQPNSPYSASKASADFLARAWHHTYGLPVIITNCSNNYGPRQHPEKLIPRMILSALQEKALPVYGDGRNVRDWIFVRDHCEGIALALEKGKPGSTYCFGGRSERRNIQVVHSICDLLDEMSPRSNGQSHRELITFVPDRLGHDWRYAIDDGKAAEELAYAPKVPHFESGLRDTLHWYLSNKDWIKNRSSSNLTSGESPSTQSLSSKNTPLLSS